MSDFDQRKTNKRYDLAVFIGRFQPMHFGHVKVIENALKHAERVLILVGSANLARDTRNPFTYDERAALIHEALIGTPTIGQVEGPNAPPNFRQRFEVRPLDDSPYDKSGWINRVNVAARAATRALRPRICLTGNIRDATSEYLTWFPAWDYLPSPDTGFNATSIRRDYFAGHVNFQDTGWKDQGVIWPKVCPAETISFLDKFRGSPFYAYLMDQKAAEEEYHAKWGKGPFQTVDPVIVKGDHVLMIERGGAEGTGQLALPGGFLEPGERLFDGAVREGIEETGLFLPDPYIRGDSPPAEDVAQAQATLKSYLRGRGERFDDPHRSRRGHLITEGFLFMLPDGHGLPHVAGKDDAKRAFWMPISEVRPDITFEDHAFIIDRMLSLYA